MSRLTRRSFHRLSALAVAVLVASGTSVLAQDSGPRHGGTLTVLAVSEPPDLVTIARPGNETIATKVHEGLVRHDLDQNALPHLATSWTISDDGLEYTFNLREGVKWHDGTPFTARDVIYSILTLKDIHPRRRTTFGSIEEVVARDDLTVVIRLSTPAPYLLDSLTAAASPIFPAHLYEGTDAASNPYNLRPVGTGPFRFVEWERGSHVLLERNPDYWEQPKPYLDQLIIRFIPDSGARIAAFESGEVDLGGNNPVPLTEIERLRGLAHLGVETRGYERYGAQTQFFFNLENEILADVGVRLAVAHAIDIEELARIAWYGYADLSPTPIGLGLAKFHNPEIRHYPFDPAKAEELLDDAGYPRGANGSRFSVRILPNPFSEANRRVADYLKQSLENVGIDAQINSYDFATYVRTVFTDRAFDIDIENSSAGFDPTDGVHRLYWSKNFRVGLPFSNGSRFESAETDRLLEAASVENDEDKRRELYREFQRDVHAMLPGVNMVSPHNFTIFNRRVKDHTVWGDGINSGFGEVYVEQ